MPRALLTPLTLPDFRRLWFGLFVSMTGSTLRNAAVLWHVTLLVQKEQRALALAVVGLVRVVPIVVCALLAGVLADAVDRKRLLIAINAVLLCVSTGLAVATFNDWLTPVGLYFAVAVMAGASTFDNPARSALYPMLVPRHELSKAIVLTSSAFQVASMLGPALAGTVIGRWGVGAAYTLDALSFVFILGALFRLESSGAPRSSKRAELNLEAVLEGLRFVFRHPLIRASMLLDFVATFLGSATALLPLYAQDILHVDASGYGLLASAIAFGSATTSLLLASWVERVSSRGKLLLTAVASYGVGTALFALSKQFWLSFACLFLVGMSDTVSTLLRQLIRQLESPDGLRGRMAGVNLIFFMGGPQLGELEAGLLAQAFGPVTSVFSGGVACVLVTAAFAWKLPNLLRYVRAPDGSGELS
jgi:MFS family permease